MKFLLETLQPDQLVDFGFGGLFAMFAGLFMFFLIFGIILWVYGSFAFMAIGKRTNHPTPGIAWIPLIGPSLIASKAAGMHWWPILLMVGIFIPAIGIIFNLAFVVFSTIWMWKTFEALGRPGWWAILLVIPFINLIGIVLIGIAAWGNKD